MIDIYRLQKNSSCRHVQVKLGIEYKGGEEGIKLTEKVLKLFSNDEMVENIAKICEVSEDIVKEIIE